MLATTHFDNLLVLLFFGVAILFQLLSAAVAKKRKQQRGDPRRRSTSQTSRPLTTEVDQSDEDRIRKFLEALGQPTTSKPPPPAAPRPTIQKPIVVERREPEVLRRRWVAPNLPPLTTRPPDLPEPTELPREVRLPGQIPPIRKAKTFRPTTPDAPFEVHKGQQPLETPPPITSPAEVYALATAPAAKTIQTKTDFATLLRSTSGLRDAIILREIFGPPRSMQPLDLVGSV
jgi:hypothetical protein